MELASATLPKSSSGLPVDMNEKLLDGFADALGIVVADLRKEWQRDLERIGADARATIAELRLQLNALKSDLREGAEHSSNLVAEALAKVKDGAPGRDGLNGEAGRDGEPGQIGPAGKDGANGRDGIDGKDGQPGNDGRDGVGLAGAIMDRSGNLILTLTDGSTRDLGLVVGKDGSEGIQGALGAPGIDGQPGKDADPAALLSLEKRIADCEASIPVMVKAAVAEIELAEPDTEIVAEAIRKEFEAALAAIPKSADLASVEAMVAGRLAALPAPKDGKDGLPGAPGKDGQDGNDGRDADNVEIAKLLIPEVERAVAALPKPKDGVDGRDGESVAREEVMKIVAAELEKAVKDIPVPRDGRDGEPGRDGRDGFGFDDLDVEYDGERTLSIVFTKGAHVEKRTIYLPIVIDRGVFKEGQSYVAGDGATYGGCYWIAQKETSQKPGEGQTDWRLSVKRGRDGKQGPAGRDLRPHEPVKV